MNTDKLLKAIRILIKEELKQQLPKLIKEVVKKEVKLAENRLLKEVKKTTKKSSHSVNETIDTTDPFERAEQALQSHREEEKKFSKDPMINKILNETATQYTPGQLNSTTYDSTQPFETEERTMNFNSSNMGSMINSNMAEKLGYGEFSKQPPIPTKTHTGKVVDVNDPTTQPVIKALTRDYSELMKHMNNKKK